MHVRRKCVLIVFTLHKKNQHNVFGGMIKKTAGTFLNEVFNATMDKPGTGRHVTVVMKTM